MLAYYETIIISDSDESEDEEDAEKEKPKEESNAEESKKDEEKMETEAKPEEKPEGEPDGEDDDEDEESAGGRVSNLHLFKTYLIFNFRMMVQNFKRKSRQPHKVKRNRAKK